MLSQLQQCLAFKSWRTRNLLINSIFLKHFTYVLWQRLWHLLSDLPSYLRWSNRSIQKIYKFTNTEAVSTEILMVFSNILNMKNGSIICSKGTYIRWKNPTKKNQQKNKSNRENKEKQITEEKNKGKADFTKLYEKGSI